MKLNKFNLRVKYLILLLVSSVALIYLYNIQIQPNNISQGLQPLHLRIFDYLYILIIVFLLTFILPKTTLLPSNIFIYVYSLYIIFSGAIFWQVSGKLDQLQAMELFIIHFVPILLLWSAIKLTSSIKLPTIKLYRVEARCYQEYVAVCFIVLSIYLAWQKMGGFHFGFQHSYTRRLEARSLIGHSLLAYMLSITTNGFIPFLAFMATHKRKYLLLILAIIAALLCYGLSGVKAPIQYALILATLGYLISSQKEHKLFIYGLYALVLLIAISVIQCTMLGHSSIASILLRRALVVPPQLQGYFYDYINNIKPFYQVAGSTSHLPVTFTIGKIYFHNINTNADSNTFLVALAHGGMLNYLLANVVVVTFYILLDICYHFYQQKEFLAIGLIYALLVVEQYYTTAFVSSGVFLLFVLSVIIRNSHQQHKYNNIVSNKLERKE